ncbi:Hypothetical protein FKW44_003669, partial [Caligus rogercresseyi]
MPAPSNNGPNFHRNSIESSSVRLRRRKDAPESKKRNFRHSGDFLMPPSEQAPVRSSNGNRRRSQEFRSFLSYLHRGTNGLPRDTGSENAES